MGLPLKEDKGSSGGVGSSSPVFVDAEVVGQCKHPSPCVPTCLGAFVWCLFLEPVASCLLAHVLGVSSKCLTSLSFLSDSPPPPSLPPSPLCQNPTHMRGIISFPPLPFTSEPVTMHNSPDILPLPSIHVC